MGVKWHTLELQGERMTIDEREHAQRRRWVARGDTSQTAAAQRCATQRQHRVKRECSKLVALDVNRQRLARCGHVHGVALLHPHERGYVQRLCKAGG